MGALTKEQILTANDVKMEKVPVPELAPDTDLDPYLMVRTMTSAQRDKWDEMGVDTDKSDPKKKKIVVNMTNYRARLLAFTVCDDDGNLLFAVEDIDALAQKSAVAIDRAYDAALKINGLHQSAVEEETKNS